ncbi:uncharacterized protein N7459_006034 [Penicillium hispanicum]|uniref:uncharacterized protein n=1 Tax=Penicillium hispanicum TaxID=1080232 RepID=UPI00253F812A|nr:uncharacterized protein N7459_006034 [Penicillium hispanicum]KAJ5580049.1 hypothetical protein N7459_006034 [Penicillium hispanicum]
MATAGVEAVQVYKGLVDSLLDRAAQIKSDKQIEPPLTETLLGESIWQVPEELQGAVQSLNQQTQFAAVEIAFREKFYRVLASTSIDDPAFIHIWNLLDIVSIFSDNEKCEPGLIFWLIEELLDSQTIDGCRKVFDYLESRRERNIKKHFKQKSLVILRSCNELLRRLSRAEDTVFCGRVFIFLFQSFPLGDKSSVNLRGEFHTENVTTFDEITTPAPGNDEGDTAMAEGNEGSTTTEGKTEGTAQSEGPDAATAPEEPAKVPNVIVSAEQGERPKGEVDLDALYPIFWSLQSYFSTPIKTFDPERLASFKAGLEATLSAFKKIRPEMENQGTARSSEEARKSHKRKRTADEGEVGTSFNPKYLTSRDLFGLEVSDMAFRRHVLVQALILLDFMLSLTPQSKARLADATNKSVLYGFVLSEEDAKWASNMRKEIGVYLQDGAIGKFYFRMVDTVLSRDKNWARWKAEACPPIERPAVSLPDYVTARESASKTYANKRLRPSPMGSLDLKFLSDSEALTNIERLKESDRFSVPAADSLMMGIMDDEMDIDMAQTSDDKETAQRSKSSKTWRVLRLSAKSKLAAFDKIDDGNNLKALFESPAAPTETPQPGEGADGTAQSHDEALQGPRDASQEDVELEDAPEQNKDETANTQQEMTVANEDNNATSEQGPDSSNAPSGDNTKEDPAS